MTNGQKLYEMWERTCGAARTWWMLTDQEREDWETFAMNLSLDHGLQLE